MRLLLSRWSLVLLLGLALPFAGCDSEGEDGTTADVTVMTYNLYLGADIFALVGQPAEQIPAIAGQLFARVRATDFPTRAGAIAAIIEAEAPDLVGLQEVTWYRSGPGNDPEEATQNEFDFLALLTAELEARELDYVVVATTVNADVELPAIVDGGLRDIRLTDRDVILARAGVEVSNVVEENFSEGVTAPVPVGGSTVLFYRGYNALTATVDGASFTFANAHLEVDDGNNAGAALAQHGQAAELILALSSSAEPVVLVGDFNSDPDDATEIPQTNQTTYGLLTNTYADAAVRAGTTGDTCCQDDDLLNTESDLDQRIDLVLSRGDVSVESVEVVGDEPADRVGNLWPSDHAGVVARLRVTG